MYEIAHNAINGTLLKMWYEKTGRPNIIIILTPDLRAPTGRPSTFSFVFLVFLSVSLEVTVTSLHPPRLCRIAVFSIKPTFSLITSSVERCNGGRTRRECLPDRAAGAAAHRSRVPEHPQRDALACEALLRSALRFRSPSHFTRIAGERASARRQASATHLHIKY